MTRTLSKTFLLKTYPKISPSSNFLYVFKEEKKNLWFVEDFSFTSVGSPIFWNSWVYMRFLCEKYVNCCRLARFRNVRKRIVWVKTSGAFKCWRNYQGLNFLRFFINSRLKMKLLYTFSCQYNQKFKKIF